MKWFLYITLFALILPASYKFGVLLDYSIQHQKYATELCINKDAPEKKCNGKCQLAMTVESNNSPDSPPVAPLLSHIEVGPLYFTDNQLKAHFVLPSNELINNWYYLNHYTFQVVKEIYHPPKAS